MNRDKFFDIPNYEGFYKINEDGIVISAERDFIKRNGIRYYKPEAEIKSHKLKNGYFVVDLYCNDKRKTLYIHRILCEIFKNLDTKSNFVINHIDNNRANNDLQNLEVVNQRYNASCHQYLDENKSSNYVGVCFDICNKKWKSCINYCGKSYHLGSFIFEENARKAYLMALKRINNNEEPKRYINFKDNVRDIPFCKRTKKWRPAVWYNSKNIYMGRYINKEDALIAYENKFKEIYKDKYEF